MKNIKTIKYLFILIFAFSSCDDFVDVKPIGPDADDYFNTAQEYESALIGAYDMLQATFWNVSLAVVASDDIIGGGDAFNYDQPVLQNVNSMIHTPSDEEQIRDVWNLMYAGINRANYLLEFKDKIDFAGKDEIIAQAYFLRAYYTFELAKFFGNIPLNIEDRGGVKRIVDKRIFFGEQFDVKRVGSISAVYSLIEEDLKEAIAVLPASQSEIYKVNKSAAQALLGKVYLYHATFDNTKFGEAATTFNQVIGKYSLAQGADYLNLFEGSGENGVESVFEIQYTGVEPAGWGCIICSEGSYFVQFNGPRSPYDGVDFHSGWGFNLPTQQLFDLFDANDNRIKTTFLDLRNDQDKYSQGRDDTGFFNRKYLPRKADTRAGSDPLNHSNNYRAIRYADVLLMAAEAEVQSGGSTPNAEKYLNEVRARAYGNNSKDYTAAEGSLIDAIYTERRKEFAGEGLRFFDLVRTGKAKAAFDAYNASKPAAFNSVSFVENKNEIFPIPLVELQLAKAVDTWGQNPNY